MLSLYSPGGSAAAFVEKNLRCCTQRAAGMTVAPSYRPSSADSYMLSSSYGFICFAAKVPPLRPFCECKGTYQPLTPCIFCRERPACQLPLSSSSDGSSNPGTVCTLSSSVQGSILSTSNSIGLSPGSSGPLMFSLVSVALKS